MMHRQEKMASSTSRETREGDIKSVPMLQSQANDRQLTPPPTPPDKVQHDLFWRETVLYWNRSDYRWSLIEYIPCLMGIIWDEERMGRIETLSSFPIEAQYYFVKSHDAQIFSTGNVNYYRLFRTRVGPNPGSHSRRMSEPEVSGSRFSDPQGITQESFLFGRFLRHVLKTTKVSCTVLILSLKFAQLFLQRVRSMGFSNCAGLQSNQFRLFVTSLLLADKYSEDHPYTNKSWSSLSGLPVDDLNHMERIYLAIMQHGLYVPESEFREWTKSLQNLCQWSTPNPHHPENSRLQAANFGVSSSRRVSYSSSTTTNVTVPQETEKVSFWSRFKFHRK